MTFAFVAKHRHIWPVSWMCDVLGVSRSGFVEQLDSIAPEDVADALKAAGLPFRRSGGQTLITFGDGSQVSHGVAVKTGLIKVSRA